MEGVVPFDIHPGESMGLGIEVVFVRLVRYSVY